MHVRPLLLAIPFVVTPVCLAQGPTLDWVNALGGPDWDACRSADHTSDGGSIVLGYSESNAGDVLGNHGGSDVTLVRLDQEGGVMWQRC